MDWTDNKQSDQMYYLREISKRNKTYWPVREEHDATI